MTVKSAFDEIFEHRMTYPDVAYQERLSRLIGLDDHKSRLINILSVLISVQGEEIFR